MKKESAVITVYMSLILILVMALIFTLVESARVSALSTKLRCVTYMAADACFSAFSQPIFENYGIMVLWCEENEFLESFKEYAAKSLNTEDVSPLPYAEMYGAGLSDVSLISTSGPMDENGKVFADQVLEYMDCFLLEDVAERILDNVSIFDQGEKVNDFMDEIEKYSDVFTKLEKQVGEVNSKVTKAQAYANDPADILNDLSNCLDNFDAGDEDSTSDFSVSLQKLKTSKNQLKDRLEDIDEATDKYYEYAQDAKAATEELEEKLNINKSDYTDDVYAAVSEQLEDLKEKSSDTDFDYYLVVANEKTTDDYISKLDSLDNFFEETSQELSEENADYYRSLTDSYSQKFDDFNLSELSINYDSSKEEKEDDSFIDAISDLFNNGILEFVAEDISENTIESDKLPSAQKESDPSLSEGKINLLEAASDSAIFGEYILQHFGNYAKQKDDSALKYEAEYVISGKNSDRDNLSSIVGDIALIRAGCNLISILKSTSKKAETLELATAIAGCTGMPIVIKIVQILLMGVWALAESIADVKALLDGHKIPTIKDDGDWYISLAGLKNFSGDSLGETSGDKGLSYESYLRLLLLMQTGENMNFRTMDLIQANMCKNENSEFNFSKCITKVEILATYNAPQLFVTLPFAKSLLNPSGEDFQFTITQQYNY